MPNYCFLIHEGYPSSWLAAPRGTRGEQGPHSSHAAGGSATAQSLCCGRHRGVLVSDLQVSCIKHAAAEARSYCPPPKEYIGLLSPKMSERFRKYINLLVFAWFRGFLMLQVWCFKGGFILRASEVLGPSQGESDSCLPSFCRARGWRDGISTHELTLYM